MEDVPPFVSFAIGQMVATGSAVTAIVLWRGASLKEAFGAIRLLRICRRSQGLSRSLERQLTLHAVRLFLMTTLLLFAAITFQNLYLVTRNAFLFYAPEKLDDGAAAVAIFEMLAASKFSLIFSFVTVLPATTEWLLTSLAIDETVPLVLEQVKPELPHEAYYFGLKHADLESLWHQRIDLIEQFNLGIEIKSARAAMRRSHITWPEFVSLACKYRVAVCKQSTFDPNSK